MKIFKLISICCLISLMVISCTKDEVKPEMRLLKINTKTYAGTTTTTTYHYNTSNQLVEVKNNWFDERFTYSSDGKLSVYESVFDNRYRKYEYFYINGRLDKAITSNNTPDETDTTLYIYDNSGKIVKTKYLSYYNQTEYDYTCDDNGRIKTIESSENQSEWIWWDEAGNLTQHSWKRRNYTTGGIDSIGVKYSYDSGKNFLKAIHYPAEYIFIRSLDPSPNESTSNCLDNGYYHPGWPLYSGPLSIQAYNSERYPTNISIGETSWELFYEEY